MRVNDEVMRVTSVGPEHVDLGSINSLAEELDRSSQSVSAQSGLASVSRLSVWAIVLAVNTIGALFACTAGVRSEAGSRNAVHTTLLN